MLTNSAALRSSHGSTTPQAMEAVKALLLLPSSGVEAPTPGTGAGTGIRPLAGRLLHYDALRGAFLSLALPKARDAGCLVCAPSARIRSMEDSGAWIGAAGLRGEARGGGGAKPVLGC